MAKLTINTGTSAGSGDGDSLYSAFNKVNSNFTELYTQLGGTDTAAKKDIQGSVFADDSTLLVDGVNGTLNGSLTGNVTGDVTGNLTGDVTGNITSSGTSTFSGTVNLTGATISSDVNFGDNDLTDINNLTIGGSLLTETMSPLLATAGNGQTLTLAGGQSTAGDGGDAIINAGAGTGSNGDVQIGASNTTNIVIGDGTNTVDYPSGTTVDFTGTTVTGLSQSLMPYKVVQIAVNYDYSPAVGEKLLIEDTVGGTDILLPTSATVGEIITIRKHPSSVSDISVQWDNSGTPTNLESVAIQSTFLYSNTGATGGWIVIEKWQTQ